MRRYDLQVVDSAIETARDGGQVVCYEPDRAGRRTQIRVTIRLEGKDVPYVSSVEYQTAAFLRGPANPKLSAIGQPAMRPDNMDMGRLQRTGDNHAQERTTE